MLKVAKVGKLAVQVAGVVAMGVMVNDFTTKYFAEPLQKFMDSMAEEKYKMDKEKIEKGLK